MDFDDFEVSCSFPSLSSSWSSFLSEDDDTLELERHLHHQLEEEDSQQLVASIKSLHLNHQESNDSTITELSSWSFTSSNHGATTTNKPKRRRIDDDGAATTSSSRGGGGVLDRRHNIGSGMVRSMHITSGLNTLVCM